MSFISYQTNQQVQYIDEYTTSDEKMTERRNPRHKLKSCSVSFFFLIWSLCPSTFSRKNIFDSMNFIYIGCCSHDTSRWYC